MNQSPVPVAADQIGRHSQMIIASLMMGLLAFGVIAYAVAHGNKAQLGVISYLGAGLFAMNTIVALMVSRSVTARAIQQIAAQQPTDWRTALAPVYSANQILSKAPLEGAGFFNGIAYLIESHWMSLAIMFCIVSMMSLTFPSQSQFESWAEQVQRDHL